MDMGGDCPATATIQLGGVPCAVVCNLPAGHLGAGHEDLVLGAWIEPPAERHGGGRG
ncbi:hypothetical protein GCM10010441_75600 [Kitasatospora paracochleata]